MVPIFKKYGQLFKHDIGAVFDNETGKYIGTALFCMSVRHINISVNIKDFKFGSMCFQNVMFQNKEVKRILTPMPQAIDLFKGGRQLQPTDDFIIIEWCNIENPYASFELPF